MAGRDQISSTRTKPRVGRQPRAVKVDSGITQAGLADLLGVSQYTISSALTGSGRVADDLRDRIQREAERLGYRPHQAARAMRSGRFQRVVLVQADIMRVSWLPTTLLYALHHALQCRGASLEVAIIPQQDFGNEATLPRILSEHGADGLILNYQAEPPAALIKSLSRQQLPVVWLNQPQVGDTAQPDDTHAGMMIASHLRELGHRRIIYLDFQVTHEATAHISRHERRAGVRRAFAGGDCHLVECCPDADVGNPVDYCVKILRDRTITAAIGYSSHETITLALAAQRLCLSIPRELSLATTASEAVLHGVPIAYAASPIKAMADAAIELLVARQAQPRRPVRHLKLPYTLMDGDSCLPPLES